jgi:hypothetical protein
MTWACAASPCAAVHESQHLRSSWPTTGRFVTIGLGPYKAYGEHRQTIDLVTRATADRRTLQIAVLLGLPRGGRVKMNLRVAETNELMESFGAGVRVLPPASLRAKVRSQARKILRIASPR